MRARVVAFLFVGVAGLAAPLFAAPAEDGARDTATPSAVAVQQVELPLPRIRDEAAMVLVGTALIGLGAVVRRSA
jgi:hypothetical protein